MSWMDDHYPIYNDGSARTGDLDREVESGAIRKTSNGYWDPDSGEEWWNDGTRKK